MRYAVLSDIHGNLEALSAVMEFLAAQRIDRYLCLGDTMGYGADPTRCLERLKACEAVMVAGNHDLACVGKLDVHWFNEAARAAILWTRDQLSFTDVNELRRLPLTETVGPCTLVHGTLRHPERFEYLVDVAQAVDTMIVCKTLLCLMGHTHVPCFIEYNRSERRLTRILTFEKELADISFEDGAALRYILNPGSVGQPRDGNPRASVAILDVDRKRAAIHRVPYDVAAAQRKIRDARFPGFLADRLAMGR